MRRTVLLFTALLALAAAAAATFDFSSKAVSRRAPPPTKPVASVPASTRDRIFLDPAQQKLAASTGGFVSAPQSLLRIDRAMHYGDWKWRDEGVPSGPTTVRVDLRTQLLSVFRGGHEVGTAVVLYGADKKETPLGRFPILWKGRDHRSSLYDAPMPFTLRLTGDGVAIHGSDVRWGAATHGCIGVPKEFAEHLFALAKVGDPVQIVRSVSSAARPGGR